jgi:hypothetical protein
LMEATKSNSGKQFCMTYLITKNNYMKLDFDR